MSTVGPGVLTAHEGQAVVTYDVPIPLSELQRVGAEAARMLDAPFDRCAFSAPVASALGVRFAVIVQPTNTTKEG